jgi:Rieske 2Fe-2S family protein
MPSALTTPAWVANLVAQCRPGCALPRPFYLEPEVFNLDIERVFLRNWIYAGHVASIPKPGDYFLYDLAEESILVIRGPGNEVHAMFNICRHRGSRVCIEEYGAAKKKLVCPYHGWTYATDGAVMAAPGAPAGFDKSTMGLKPLEVRVVEGLIFVCAADSAPLGEIERDLTGLLSQYGLADTRIAYHRRYLCPAHWKLVYENFLERFADAKSDDGSAIRLTAARYHSCSRFALKSGHQTATKSGQPAAPLLGQLKEYDGKVAWAQVLASWVVVANDHAVLIRFTPIDPKVTEMDVTWLVRASAVEAVDYESENIAWLWKTTIEQTLKVCSDQQNGVMSRRYEPGPLGSGEERIGAFIEWYLKTLAL